MNSNENALTLYNDADSSDLNFDELEASLDTDLENSLADLELLKEDREKIGNPASLSETVMNVVWEQFLNQIGAVAGEEFIRENRGLTLDLSNDAHIQTTENFEKGSIAGHNSSIDYQKRYNDWQNKFQRDEDGSIKKRYDRRANREVEVLNKDARDYIDDGRPVGSATVHKDHTISAAEIIRDSEAAAHLSQEEHSSFANSDSNLLDLDGPANESKKDLRMNEWLESERFGQKPAERFNIDEQELRERDKIAREEYERVKQEGKQRSIETGKKSQRQEAARMGKHALQGIAMSLLAALVKSIFQKFAVWLKSKEKSLSSFIDKVKEAIKKFVIDLKQHLKIAAHSTISSIASMIFGPIVRTLQKAWTFIKQGYKSLKEAISYIKNPANKKKPFGILMMEVGKIIITGLSAAGAIVLGGAIEGALSTIPFFAFEIPVLGSLASIIGLFLGALISGLIGAIALNLIDKWIAKKQKDIKTGEIIHQKSKILDIQNKLLTVSQVKLDKTKESTAHQIVSRHQQAAEVAKTKISEIEINMRSISDYSYLNDITPSKNSQDLDDILTDIDAI
ncbi:MAG: cation diffusion facilitator family transporter [Muribaculaceae bacterium]|nr:cation diffusion facilitator family transporter [Muribaculaceae bacterium]